VREEGKEEDVEEVSKGTEKKTTQVSKIGLVKKTTIGTSVKKTTVGTAQKKTTQGTTVKKTTQVSAK
jgi:hypothetical protein